MDCCELSLIVICNTDIRDGEGQKSCDTNLIMISLFALSQ